MFKNISMTGTGVAVYLLALFLNYMGLSYETGTLQGVVDAFLVILGFVWMLYGQMRRKDLFMGLWRK